MPTRSAADVHTAPSGKIEHDREMLLTTRTDMVYYIGPFGGHGEDDMLLESMTV